MMTIGLKIADLVLTAIAKFIADADGRPASQVKTDILTELLQTDKDLADAETREEAARHTS